MLNCSPGTPVHKPRNSLQTNHLTHFGPKTHGTHPVHKILNLRLIYADFTAGGTKADYNRPKSGTHGTQMNNRMCSIVIRYTWYTSARYTNASIPHPDHLPNIRDPQTFKTFETFNNFETFTLYTNSQRTWSLSTIPSSDHTLSERSIPAPFVLRPNLSFPLSACGRVTFPVSRDPWKMTPIVAG